MSDATDEARTHGETGENLWEGTGWIPRLLLTVLIFVLVHYS